MEDWNSNIWKILVPANLAVLRVPLQEKLLLRELNWTLTLEKRPHIVDDSCWRLFNWSTTQKEESQ